MLDHGWPTEEEEAALDRAEAKTQKAIRDGEIEPDDHDELVADCESARRHRMDLRENERRVLAHHGA